MIWYYAGRRKEAETDDAPYKDPLIGAELTPSQKATVKYFLVVTLLFLLQIILGIITAHYGVEGDGFYGIPFGNFLPYVVTRTWHVQLGIFWIATAWLAAGLFVGRSSPESGTEVSEARRRRAVRRIVGRCARLDGRQWLSVMNMLKGDAWFWFGHQGYEYVDLGRVWQAALLVGLLLWLFLIFRTASPGTQGERAAAIADLSLSVLYGGHRILLHAGTVLGNADEPLRRRILAVVGRASLGRGIL